MGYIFLERNLFFIIKGRINKIIIEDNRAITPPNLLGIDRKMAYANKKYHSGWMCGGVIKILEGIKFSVSERIYGNLILNEIKIINDNIKPNISFKEK